MLRRKLLISFLLLFFPWSNSYSFEGKKHENRCWPEDYKGKPTVCEAFLQSFFYFISNTNYVIKLDSADPNNGEGEDEQCIIPRGIDQVMVIVTGSFRFTTSPFMGWTVKHGGRQNAVSRYGVKKKIHTAGYIKKQKQEKSFVINGKLPSDEPDIELCAPEKGKVREPWNLGGTFGWILPVPEDGVFQFKINDDIYSDNMGFLEVRVYEVSRLQKYVKGNI